MLRVRVHRCCFCINIGMAVHWVWSSASLNNEIKWVAWKCPPEEQASSSFKIWKLGDGEWGGTDSPLLNLGAVSELDKV